MASGFSFWSALKVERQFVSNIPLVGFACRSSTEHLSCLVDGIE